MTGLVLGNIDYTGGYQGGKGHTSDEGHQLQQGLVEAGWQIAGVGYGDGCADVPTLLERYKPDRVFVQDVRDWLPESNISFRKDVGFKRIEALGKSGISAFTVLKDAWGWEPEQKKVAADIKAKGIFTYYHHDVVREVAEWSAKYNLHRIYHSVDAEFIQTLDLKAERKRVIVTGANGKCYPLRRLALQNAAALGIHSQAHPGYSNRGADTPNYLKRIAGYRVHIATASKWEVAFRKIIESVCCGCTPITNLPAYDVLPVIDKALLRVSSNISVGELAAAIEQADAEWDLQERLNFAAEAWAYYDYRLAGKRLSHAMEGQS